MYTEIRSLIKCLEAKDSLRFRSIRVVRDQLTLIQGLVHHKEGPSITELNQRPNCIEEHIVREKVANLLEPSRIDIRVQSIVEDEFSEVSRSLSNISRASKWNDSKLEYSHVEHANHYETCFRADGEESNFGSKPY